MGQPYGAPPISSGNWSCSRRYEGLGSFGLETSLARLGRIATTERHVPALARDDDELLPLRAAILARLLHGGIGCLVSRDEDGIAGGADADLISSRLDLCYFSDI